jgi:AP-1 complex subunit mu
MKAAGLCGWLNAWLLLAAQFKDRSTANNVEIILPLPDDAITPAVKTPVGSAV